MLTTVLFALLSAGPAGDAPKKADPLAKSSLFATEPSTKSTSPKVPVVTTPHWRLLAPELRAPGGKRPEPIAKIITDPSELAVSMGLGLGKEKEALQKATRAFAVKELDFKKHSIVILAVGQRPSGGYSVEIGGVVVADGNVKIQWKEKRPDPDTITTAVITYPGIAVLISKPTGKIAFDPPVKFPGK